MLAFTLVLMLPAEFPHLLSSDHYLYTDSSTPQTFSVYSVAGIIVSKDTAVWNTTTSHTSSPLPGQTSLLSKEYPTHIAEFFPSRGIY